jgi:hypothetical protein
MGPGRIPKKGNREQPDVNYVDQLYVLRIPEEKSTVNTETAYI